MLSRALEGSPTASAEWRKLGGTRDAKPGAPETDEERIARSKADADELLTNTGLFVDHEGESDNRKMWKPILHPIAVEFLRANPNEPAAVFARQWFKERGQRCPID